MKPLKDYSFVRGFNYTQSNVWTDVNFWEEYDHDIVERDLGYAERLRLNSARIFSAFAWLFSMSISGPLNSFPKIPMMTSSCNPYQF